MTKVVTAMSRVKSVLNLLGFKAFPAQSHSKCVRHYRKIRLDKIGEVKEMKEASDLYTSGQTFIHRAFPYRGIIVYSWSVKIHDYALENKRKNQKNGNLNSNEKISTEKEVKTYYQVLVDSRDSDGKHFNNKNLTVKYFPEHAQKVKEIPDMDYVCHEDIIPYQSTVPVEPIFHPAFYTFFDRQQDKDSGSVFALRDKVEKAQTAENSWMCVSDVYKDTTDDLQVTVIPFYMGSQFESCHTWRYSIRIDYHGNDKISILDKILHLTIDNNLVTNASVMMDCDLDEKMSAYQFYDNILLESDSAQMWGEFTVERGDNTRSRCTIPVIKLNVSDNQNLRLSITDLKNLGS